MQNLMALNNASMKTVVETFIIEETQELIYDNEALDQWNSMVSELGLRGQTQIQVKDKSPIPFLHMKAPLVRVFETLCPRKVDVTEYNKTPIPVEILRLVSLSTREGYFNNVQIWYDDEAPDPACVGLVGEHYCYSKSYNGLGTFKTEKELNAFKEENSEAYGSHFNVTGTYLIGRWADVKQSLEQLTAKAKVLFTAKKKDEYQKAIRDANRHIEDLEIEANVAFGYTVENEELAF